MDHNTIAILSIGMGIWLIIAAHFRQLVEGVELIGQILGVL